MGSLNIHHENQDLSRLSKLAQLISQDPDHATRVIHGSPGVYLHQALALMMHPIIEQREKLGPGEVLVHIIREPRFWIQLPYNVDDTIDRIVVGSRSEEEKVRGPCLWAVMKLVVQEGPVREKVSSSMGCCMLRINICCYVSECSTT